MQHPFAELIGLRIDEQRAGHSTLSLTVRPEHLNPHGVVHGAVVFALADTGMGAGRHCGSTSTSSPRASRSTTPRRGTWMMPRPARHWRRRC